MQRVRDESGKWIGECLGGKTGGATGVALVLGSKFGDNGTNPLRGLVGLCASESVRTVICWASRKGCPRVPRDRAGQTGWVG